MAEAPHKYVMTISRTTIDKLGIRLYDKPSTAVAELVANAYDADATEVKITVPCGKWLARRKKGKITELNFELVIEDNGHGLTTDEVNDFLLKVGTDRRTDTKRGPFSRKFQRKVMGRKGIGKFAPFGICRKIEIITSGGKKEAKGFKISHLFLEYEDMNKETEKPYYPTVGKFDGQFVQNTGTKIKLSRFQYRRTPSLDLFTKQLARIFGIKSKDWSIKVFDSESKANATVGELGIDSIAETMIDVADRPIILPDKTKLKVKGWVAFSKDPYKDELIAGIRVYARGKIVAQTRDFGLEAGFHGEHTLRSYLVGELYAEWLDDDKYDDLVRTDRQDILWSDERGEAFKSWGQELLRELARKWSGARRERTWEVFLEKSKLEFEVKKRFSDVELQKKAIEVGKIFGKVIGRDELEDNDYVESMKEFIFSIAPHQVFLDSLREIGDATSSPLQAIAEMFARARIGELASLGQVADERLSAIGILKEKIDHQSEEKDLQEILERSPWLIDAEWTLFGANESLHTLRDRFERWYKTKTGESILTSAISAQKGRKRPDFVMISVQSGLEIIEIKKPGHKLQDDEYERLQLYIDHLRDFLEEHKDFKKEFPNGVHATLVCDSLGLSRTTQRAFYSLEKDGTLSHKKWNEFIKSTEKRHQDFLKVARKKVKEN